MGSLTPLVSILIPAYNAEKWIGDTLRSALAQTWPNREIIIVDDGSTDNTLEIAKSFESQTVKVITQRNAGACSTRNAALGLASGDYIQWLDADDLLAPDKISLQLGAADADQNSRVLLTSSFGTFYYRHQKARYNPNRLWQDLEPVQWIKTRFTENAWMNPAAWLVSRTLSDSAGPWDERLSSSGDDDGEYICRVAAVSDKVKFVRQAKCYYRVGHSASLSRRRSDSAYESLVLSTKLCMQHLLSLEDSEQTRRACIMLLENRLWHFHPEKSELIRQLEELARDLGAGTLHLRETWRYLLVGRYFGWNTAKILRNIWSGAKVSSNKNWDRLLHLLADR
jgi:glycosyltransferase involved in cell wall biosynthesis